MRGVPARMPAGQGPPAAACLGLEGPAHNQEHARIVNRLVPESRRFSLCSTVSTASPHTTVRSRRRKPLDGLETRCSAGERQKTTVAWSFGMAWDNSSVHGAYGAAAFVRVGMVTKVTCRAGRATANGTSCTHKTRAALCISLVWAFQWIAPMSGRSDRDDRALWLFHQSQLLLADSSASGHTRVADDVAGCGRERTFKNRFGRVSDMWIWQAETATSPHFRFIIEWGMKASTGSVAPMWSFRLFQPRQSGVGKTR
jgi:hypothetical protein